MSNYLNEDLIISPEYETMPVVLQANNNIARKRGSLICRKATDDGTLDIYGTSNYTVPFGVLLEDVEKDTNAHSVQVLVFGEVTATKLYKDVISDTTHTLTAMAYTAYATDPDGGDNLILRKCREVGVYAK